MKYSSKANGFTLVEVMFTTALVSVFGLVIYSILTTSTILGAKNTAVNTAHQQARTVMLQMLQDLHSSVSLPRMVATNGTPWPSPVPNVSPSPAPGISFQLWSGGPYRITAAANANQSVLKITANAGLQVGQHVVVPFYQVEGDVSAYDAASGNITLKDILYYNQATSQTAITQTLPVAIKGPSGGNYSVCYVTDRCSYIVVQDGATPPPGVPTRYKLQWTGPTASSKKALAVLGSSITSATPFNMPLSSSGAPNYLAVTAIDLSTSDSNYSNRGFRSANILLNGQVPIRTRLAAYQ